MSSVGTQSVQNGYEANLSKWILLQTHNAGKFLVSHTVVIKYSIIFSVDIGIYLFWRTKQHLMQKWTGHNKQTVVPWKWKKEHNCHGHIEHYNTKVCNSPEA